MSQRLGVCLVVGCTLAILSVPCLFSKDVPATNAGAAVGAFTAKDVDGKDVSLADFKDRKAVVVVFVGTQCPINNAYMPRLGDLHREYAPKGVQFLAVNSNQQDTPKDVAEHARKYKIPFPVLKDAGNVVADLFTARRTPEAFVLDGQRVVRYRGRIDDQFGLDYRRARPPRQGLVEALDAVLAGKAVATPETAAAGCVIARVARPKEQAAVTFGKHVAPILQRHCQECHRPGQVGPMALLTYDDA